MSNRIRYILKRIIYSFITILVLVTITFLLMQLLPGEPFTAGKALPDSVMQALEKKYGLDKPVLQQLFIYIGNALRGDFGISIPDGRAVTDVIAEAFPVSFSLGIRALLFAFIMGILLGVVAAVKRGTVWDSAAMFFALVGVSVPSFIMGAVLQYFLGLKLYQATGVQVFAVIGWSDFNSKILPAFALAFGSMATVSRLMRTSMPDVLSQDYIKAAKAKGLSQRQIVWKHAVRSYAGCYRYGSPGSSCFDGCFRCREYFLYSGTWKILCNQCADSELYYDCRYYSLLRYVPDSRQSGCRFDLRIYRSTY